MSSTPMFKTTVVIWSDFDPRVEEVELSDLAREAEEGGAYASSQVTVAVERDLLTLDPDATEGMQSFFEISDEADEDDYDLDEEDEDCPHARTYADPGLPADVRVCADCTARLYLTAEQAAALAARDDEQDSPDEDEGDEG